MEPSMPSASQWNTSLILLEGGEEHHHSIRSANSSSPLLTEMSNDEDRMTKEARNLKSKDRICVLRTLGFLSHSSFVIRHS